MAPPAFHSAGGLGIPTFEGNDDEFEAFARKLSSEEDEAENEADEELARSLEQAEDLEDDNDEEEDEDDDGDAEEVSDITEGDEITDNSVPFPTINASRKKRSVYLAGGPRSYFPARVYPGLRSNPYFLYAELAYTHYKKQQLEEYLARKTVLTQLQKKRRVGYGPTSYPEPPYEPSYKPVRKVPKPHKTMYKPEPIYEPNQPSYKPKEPKKPSYHPQEPKKPSYHPQEPKKPSYHPQEPPKPSYNAQSETYKSASHPHKIDPYDAGSV